MDLRGTDVHGKTAASNFSEDQLLDAICVTNSFACSYGPAVPQQFQSATGLWYNGSLFNNDCLPNLQASFIGDIMIITSIRAIKKGEELTDNGIITNIGAIKKKNTIPQ